METNPLVAEWSNARDCRSRLTVGSNPTQRIWAINVVDAYRTFKRIRLEDIRLKGFDPLIAREHP